MSHETSKVISPDRTKLKVKQFMADSDSFKSDESFYAFVEAQNKKTPLRLTEEREREQINIQQVFENSDKN